MKKTLILLAIAASISSFAQTDFNKWSMGLSLGIHDGQAPTAIHTKLYQFQHFGLNGRYMINNRVGVMLDFGYDLFDGVNSGSRNVNYFRTSLQGVVNAGDLLRFSTFSKRFGLLIHGGAGISSMWTKKEFSANPDASFFKRSDDMINFIFGATPQLKVTERFSLNADLSFIFHHNQTYQFDMTNLSQHGAIDGYFLNASLGGTFYFGKAASHADWIPTIYGGDMSAYEKKVKELEDKLKDDDKDGIPNYNDLEATTPEGSLVYSKGQAVVGTWMELQMLLTHVQQRKVHFQRMDVKIQIMMALQIRKTIVQIKLVQWLTMVVLRRKLHQQMQLQLMDKSMMSCLITIVMI